MSLHGVRKLGEEAVSFSTKLVSGKFDGVHPLFGFKVIWNSFFRFGIEVSTTFEVNGDIVVSQFSVSDQDLEYNKEQESGLIGFIQTSVDIIVDFPSGRRDDMLNSFLGGTFIGHINRVIKDIQELSKGGVVHPFDQDHLDDTEVQDRSSDGRGSVLFSLGVNLLSLLFSQS